MAFDPNQPFTVDSAPTTQALAAPPAAPKAPAPAAPTFDPNKPFSVEAAPASPKAPDRPQHSWLTSELLGLGAGAGEAFGQQVLGAQELLGHGLSAAGFDKAGDWLIQDAVKGAKKLRGEEAPYEKEAPIGSFIGETVGSAALPGGAASKIGGTLGKAAVMGATAGALQPTDGGPDFAKQKVIQTGIGGVVGAGAGAAGSVIAPKATQAAQDLLQRGIRLTPGQIVGGAGQRIEDAIASLPFVGSLVRSARKEGIEDFNRVVINDALSPVGQSLPKNMPAGRDAIGYAQDKLRDAYSKLLTGKTFQVDPQFATDIVALRNVVTKLMPPETSALRDLVADRIIPRLQKTGTMDGDTFHELDSELTRYASRYRKSPIAGEQNLGDVIEDVQEAIRNGMERSNPGFASDYADVRRAYAMLSRVEDASMRRVASDGVFMPSDLLAASKAAAVRTGRRKAYASGSGLYQDLGETAQGVLPSKIPDSGTPERLVTMGLLGGGVYEHFLDPYSLAALGTAAVPYTDPGLWAARWLAQHQSVPSLLRQIAAGVSPEAARKAMPQ